MHRVRLSALAEVAGATVFSYPNSVHPDLQRFVSKRMKADTTELTSSHVPMLSQPDAVLNVIRRAASSVAAS
jgi:hypothetical protein